MRSSGGAATARPTTLRASATAAVSSLALKNLFLPHRDGPTPPVLRSRRVEVLSRHPRARARTGLHRKSIMLDRREVGRVLAPGRPLVSRRAASRQEERRPGEEQAPVSTSHVSTSSAFWMRPCYRRRRAWSIRDRARLNTDLVAETRNAHDPRVARRPEIGRASCRERV